MSFSTELQSFCPQYVNIIKDRDNQCFKLLSKWNDCIYINIYKSWNKESFDEIDPTTLTKYAQDWFMTLEEYLIELESIFKNSLHAEYQFEVSETKNSMTIKKIIDHEEQIMKIFCSFPITWIPYDPQRQWNQNLKLHLQFQSEINEKTSKLNNCLKENADLQIQIAQTRESHMLEKRKLMHQFIELINTKKDRIQLLTDLLSERAPKCHCNVPKKVTSNDKLDCSVTERNVSPQPSTSNSRPKSPITTRAEVVRQDSEDLLNDEIDHIVLPKRAKVDLGLNKNKESSSAKSDDKIGLIAPTKSQKAAFDINAYLDNME